MKPHSIIASLAIAFTGCAEMIKPSQQQIAAADYGAYPANYEEIVHKWIHATFFDPGSVQDLEITKPVKGWWQDPPLLGGGRKFGYTVEVYANGKNRFGGYVGRQHFQLIIRNGTIVGERNPDSPTGY